MTAEAESFLAQVRGHRLLVRGVNWLGDAVMTTPALLRLREACPGTRISLVCPAKLADVWVGHPAVDDVIGLANGEGLWSISRRLREARFGAAIILPNSPRSALETWLARIPRRAGYSRPWRDWLLTKRVLSPAGRSRMRKRSVAEIQEAIAPEAAARPAPSAYVGDVAVHQAYDYLHLLAALGACAEIVPPLLCVSAQEMDHVRQKYFVGGHAALAKPGAVIIGLNPGAEYGPAKRWPVERYVETAIGLRRSYPQAGLVVFGGKSELETGERIVSAAGVNGINLAGKTSLRELMALLKASTVLITNDTGPMHVAAALSTPVVGIYGSTSPELTAPGTPGQFPGRVVRSNAPCAPCFRRECPIDFRCMNQITSSQVLTAVQAVVAA